ncbi:Hys2 DNA polymerase III (delta) subunit [Candida orthopsilosis Co 90-125]|uniref:DNA-directed DNA polymerase n=1 Tax=Candida orthopsilosis (strain 90-125) TaxID=1136231 RepID=H8X979_CANO9|nr:Hys2 DNA polymerase III (delta) subunit [Candida orthopsilosis Co 90-125]CCG24378.1 Hys2 DNA polymerase III (delta) subunit [Candida orthopsilosis Co 90-125]
MSYSQYINKGIETQDAHRKEAAIPPEFEKRNEFFIDPKSRKYDQQYFSMYQYRYNKLQKRAWTNAMKKWGNGTKKVDGQTITKQDKILDIVGGKLCWVIGTVFVDAKYKLNILNDVERGTDDVLPLEPVSYLDGDEQPVVMLEDESGRAILHNEDFLQQNLLVTGCIVAVLGIEIQAGIFEIMDVAYPECAPQRPLSSADTRSGKIALVSGLNIGLEGHYDLKLELLKQYLVGELGGDDSKQFNSNIAQLIIAGDSIEPLQTIDEEEDLKNYITTNNYGSKNISKYNNESLKQLDQFINELIVTMPIAVMPGEHDPAEICLPQQPLHKSLFKSNQSVLGSERLSRLTNPTWIEASNVRMLGTSGQNVNDVKKYVTRQSDSDSLKIIRSSMKWQNFVPTAPDTLYCYPFEDADPFVFESELPHVYFVGNQDKFQTDTYKCPDSGAQVRLISIPQFKSTGEFIILDLDTLEVELVKIET